MGTLSVCMAASRDEATVRAILALARPVADEIVLGVDARAADAILGACGDLVDRPYVYEFESTIERHFAWLHHRCSADWILRLDDDELPGAALMEMLPELTRDRRRSLVLLPRRHLFPTRDQFIASHPWYPDYQPRLVRNIPGLWTFPGHSHTAIDALGERRRIPNAPIYHLHLAEEALEPRLATAFEREREIPGLMTECYAVNAVTLPELWTGVEIAEVPAEDRPMIEQVAVPEPALSLTPPMADRMPQHEADRLLANRSVPADAYRCAIEISDARRTLAADTVAHLEVAVENLGSERWPPADRDGPLIRLAYRWLSASGEIVIEPEGLRTSFEETVLPGAATVAMLAVEVPRASGLYVLEVDVVHEHVRWFGCAARLDLDVEALDSPAEESRLARPDMARIGI